MKCGLSHVYPMRKDVTNLVNPGENDIGGIISDPLLSTVRLMSKVAIMFAITSHRLSSAKRRPGHALSDITSLQTPERRSGVCTVFQMRKHSLSDPILR